MQSNIEENIVALFREKGFERYQQLTEQIVRRIFKEHSQFIMQKPLKSEMLDEMLNQCRYGKMQITPKGLGQVISEAESILVDRLKQLQGKDGLISKRKQVLQAMREKLKQVNRKSGQYQYENAQEIEELQKELAQFIQDEKVFAEQFQIIQKLFKKYVTSAKLKRMSVNLDPQRQYDPKLLTYLFYSALAGLVFEVFALQLRPGVNAVVIYLQVLYILFFGYYNKKAVLNLIFTNGILIIIDSLSLYFYSQPEHKIRDYEIAQDTITKVLDIGIKFSFASSIITRIFIQFLSFAYRDPPIKRVVFTIRGRAFTLNTRLNIGNGVLKKQANQEQNLFTA